MRITPASSFYLPPGLQGEVCDWLLQCPAGYNCVSRPGSSNYSCSSVCHFDYCHHHGICTHHPGQLPVCRSEHTHTHAHTPACTLVFHLWESVVHVSVPLVCCTSCLVGEDFWYMGQRCDVRMTRARLVGACLAILLVVVTVIGVLAFVAVRRYRAILIQAKVDQTRSRYAQTLWCTHSTSQLTIYTLLYKDWYTWWPWRRSFAVCSNCNSSRVH